MSSNFYLDMQGVASGVLAQFKQGTIQHVAETPGTGPAHNPGAPTTVTTTLPGAVAAGVNQRYQAAALIVGAELQVTSSIVAGLAPVVGDKLVIDGTAYRIVQVIAIPAAGTPVVWVFLIRK